jgi:uncharacterized protein YhdP
MKKLLRRLVHVLATVLALLLVLIFVFILVKDSLLKPLAERTIEEETGLRAEITDFKTTLGSGALHLREVKLYNSAEFGGALMAIIPELALDLDLTEAAQGRLHFRDLKFNLTQLDVVRNTTGRLNIEGVQKTIRERLHKRRRKKGERFEFEFGGIDRMQLTLGNVYYTDLKHPNRRRTLDLAVENESIILKDEEDLRHWAASMMLRIVLQVALTPADHGPQTGTTPAGETILEKEPKQPPSSLNPVPVPAPRPPKL